MYNLLGWLMPVIVNFLSVPLIVRMLGNDSYGILMLFTAVIGYFSIIDINLTAGSMKYISEYYAKRDEKTLNEVLTVSFVTYSVLGLVGAIFLYLSVDWFLMDMLKVPEAKKDVARTVFQLASAGFFLNIIYRYLLSIPKSVHRFDIAARNEAGFGVALIVLTVVMLYMGFDLLGIVVLRVIILFLNFLTLYITIKKIIPYARFTSPVSRQVARNMLKFTSYSFLSRMASTITGNSDRIVIGSIISSAAVTFYAVPFMLVARLMSVSQRLSFVLFPVASELDVMGEREKLEKIYIKMNRYIFFLNISLTTVLCLFSKQILQVWMGNEFAQQSYVILTIIALGYFVNTLTNIPTLVNDGLNYPKVTGYFAMTRAIIGVIALLIGAKYYGLTGVAEGYSISSIVMGTIFIFYVHKKTIKISLLKVFKEAYLKPFMLTTVVVSVILILRSVVPSSNMFYLAEGLSVLIVFAFFAYKYIFDDTMKSKLLNIFTHKLTTLI